LLYYYYYSQDENNKYSTMFPQLSEHAKKMLEDVIKHPLKPGDKRRCRVPDKPNHPLHIWSILKNCIGKDLSKIPMPVCVMIELFVSSGFWVLYI